jgi:hypothetical protein
VNWLQRAFFGALAGALVVLVFHPVSRPFVLSGMPAAPSAAYLGTTDVLVENIASLPPPTTLPERAVWLEVGAAHEMAGRRLRRDQASLLATVAADGAEQDPENAMWRQAEAAYLLLAGGDDTARAAEAWHRAGQRLRWNNYASSRLARLLRDLREYGRSHAWHFSVARKHRSPALARLIARAGNQLGRRASGDPDVVLDQIRNGILVRDGSRTLAGAVEGANLVDGSVLPSVATPREVAFARGALFDRLAALGRGEDAVWAAAAFDRNDAWRAVVDLEEAKRNAQRLDTLALVTSVAPSAFLVAAAVGAASIVAGWAAARVRLPRILQDLPWAVLLGSALGLGAYLVTGLVFPALWAAVLVASFALGSERVKEGDVAETGKGLSITLWSLAATAVATIVLAVFGASSPGSALRGSVDPVLVDGNMWREAAILTVSIVLFVAPVWAFLNRYPPSKVLPAVLKGFGLNLAVTGLVGAVVAAPVAVAADLRLSDDLSKLFLNEPNFYLTR